MVLKKALNSFIGLIMISALFASPAHSLSRKPPEPAYAPGQVVIKFREGTAQEDAAAIIGEEGCRIKRFLAGSGIYIVLLPGKLDVAEALRRFEGHQEVLYVEPVYAAQTPEDK